MYANLHDTCISGIYCASQLFPAACYIPTEEFFFFLQYIAPVLWNIQPTDTWRIMYTIIKHTGYAQLESVRQKERTKKEA